MNILSTKSTLITCSPFVTVAALKQRTFSKWLLLPEPASLNAGNFVTSLPSFNVYGSVRRKYIPLDIFTTTCNITQFIYFRKTALHVSGGISTHHQEHTQLYVQYLVHVKRYCYLPLLWAIWSWSADQLQLSHNRGRWQ